MDQPVSERLYGNWLRSNKNNTAFYLGATLHPGSTLAAASFTRNAFKASLVCQEVLDKDEGRARVGREQRLRKH